MSDKLCIDCIYQNNDDPMQECLQCRQKNNWQGKSCSNCKYANTHIKEEPCAACKNYGNWEPDEFVFKDDVNHPAHYTQGGIECIDAIRAALTPEEWRGYLKGNCLKYIWRERLKGGNQSIEKAEWYIRRLLEEV
jgi:hypothetical protein